MNKTESLLNQFASLEKPLYLHVIIGCLFALIVFSVFWLLKLIGNEGATLSLLLFDLLFVFFLFPLKGKLWLKLVLLMMGNVVGLTFNSILSFLETSKEETSSTIFFSVVYPILNMFWIVAMWAFGLSVVASHKK